ncbi:S9 family peptidase [Novosphingobium sp. KA1]|uniref:alpha/beta hydrolase family protein n=1 Tax=Novosphingobium sp. (strain KA1) TaxID=164608 RepID=UPI001A8D5E79|nr:S9 family peptidase [Novosphingobium sp. KA1]QSR15839.1 peptidase S9 [Novosphingobium sp. KA1]
MTTRGRWALAALTSIITPILAAQPALAADGSAALPPAAQPVTQPAAQPAVSAPPPLDAYGELPRIEDAALSPDGRNIASISRIDGQRRLLVVDETGKPLVNAATGDGKVRAIEWADNETMLLTTSATVAMSGFTADKYELAGTFLIPLRGGQPGILFGKTPEVADTTRGRYGIRTIGGKTVGFFGGIALSKSMEGDTFARHARTTLYAVDLKTNRPRVAATPAAENHERDWLVDGSGQVAVTLDMEVNGNWRIIAPGGLELARGVDPTGHVGLLCFGKEGTTAIYTIDDSQGVSHWYEVPLEGGDANEIFADAKIDRIFVDRATGRLLGYRTDAEGPKTVMYDPAKQVALDKVLRAFAGRNPRLVDWTPDFSQVLLSTGGNKDSGTWYLVDVPARSAGPFGYERPLIKPEQVGPISMVDYTAADGLKMDGVLTLPPGRPARNLPVVVLPHGGPASEDRPGFDWWAQAFASRGYAVFQPNFRGSTGRTDAFRHAGDGQWGRKMQTDISDGLAELVKRGIADPRRACIVGASYGGYAALAGVTLQQGLYKCAVAVAGVTDIRLMYDTEVREDLGSQMTRKVLRQQLGDPSGFDAISPRRFAAKADAPVLLIHGKDDTVVPYRQSLVMADALKDAGKPYEMVTLASEDHWLSREETRKRMLSETMRFVQKYNPAD